MPVDSLPNYAFIDAQNLYLGIISQGWELVTKNLDSI